MGLRWKVINKLVNEIIIKENYGNVAQLGRYYCGSISILFFCHRGKQGKQTNCTHRGNQKPEDRRIMVEQ